MSTNAINIQFTRFSAFYSPLIATISGGFLREEGLVPHHSIAHAGLITKRHGYEDVVVSV